MVKPGFDSGMKIWREEIAALALRWRALPVEVGHAVFADLLGRISAYPRHRFGPLPELLERAVAAAEAEGR